MTAPVKVARVFVPATSANLGAGFDCLGLALDLWNQSDFRLQGKRWLISVSGEGAGSVPSGPDNLLLRAAARLYQALEEPLPPGLQVHCRNQIPLGSGMGSSAAAHLSGLLGANALLGNPLDLPALLKLGAELEGHPDNVTPALLGGLTVAVTPDHAPEAAPLVRRLPLANLLAVLVLPHFRFPTARARAALPKVYPRAAAIYNLGRAALTVEALRAGDFALLGAVMQDRLHQPYRLPLIPGAELALSAARQAGAAACAISGAGPALIAFLSPDSSAAAAVAAAMQAEFLAAGLSSRAWTLTPSLRGAYVQAD